MLAVGAAESGVLLGTLEAWVRSNGSATRTAAEVHCHRNTVLNRLRRVEQLTGRRSPADFVPVDLDLALRAWRMG